ncbi:MAG: glycoside hydrolase family 99-like domain-containing protein [Candidatus Zipacnadales bacterium]
MLVALLGGALVAWCVSSWGQENVRTLIEWTFDEDMQGWGSPHHVSELRVEEGALQGRLMDWDPFVRSPQFEITAKPWQAIQLRMKTDCGGSAEVFWTGTTESEYGGFSPGKETFFEVIGDGEWHEYEVLPFWHNEGQIILLRLDFPRPEAADAGQKTFAVDWLRIVEFAEAREPRTNPAWDFTQESQWRGLHGVTLERTAAGLRITMGDTAAGAALSEPLDIPLEERFWVSISMAVEKGHSALLRWVSTETKGMASLSFPIRPDAKFHTYNLNLASSREWQGKLMLLGLTPSVLPGAHVTVRSITLSEEPLGPPEIEVTYAGLENAINRVGQRVPFILNLLNRGGESADDLRIATIQLPQGVQAMLGPPPSPGGPLRSPARDIQALPIVEPFDPVTYRFDVMASQPVQGDAVITLTGKGAPTEPIRAEVLIEPSLHLPKADYVPEPQPVESDYEIGAFYFPGWNSMAKWEPIRRLGPERKPVLGWYDEGNPECADWQIKWAVEHGIRFFLVDWYWSAGNRHLEHWVHNAYMKACYRKYLKWCMMWANHNPPNTHSEADQRAVTQYWLDNYFGMEEYYRIDDMPVVMIWSVGNMERDMAGKGGAKRLLDISQEMAKAAGYKGIYFVAMKWPEAGTDPELIRPLAEAGFSMTSIYHYMGHGGKAEDPRYYPFDLCVESTYPFFKAWHEANIIPFLPNLSTGWDSRPWHGDHATVIYGRTVDKFRRLCEEAKRFADETGVKRMVLGPLNEWGEGSYAEPNKEFGFGMYDAVRDVFCKKPLDGWPPNIAPTDVGLGPYDYPEPQQRVVWDFEGDTQGWGPMMGVTNVRVEGGALTLETTSNDPAITATLSQLDARKYPYMIVRMKVDALTSDSEDAQLFWATPTAGISELTSVKWRLIGDGEYHDYVVYLAENPRWRGRITIFRLDPCSHAGAKVSIDEIRMSQDGK